MIRAVFLLLFLSLSAVAEPRHVCEAWTWCPNVQMTAWCRVYGTPWAPCEAHFVPYQGVWCEGFVNPTRWVRFEQSCYFLNEENDDRPNQEID